MRPPYYYRLAIYLACPTYRLWLACKKKQLPYYEREVAERFGCRYLPLASANKVIWCHAVSLGELNTVYPLLKLLLDEGYALWISSTTQTGFDRVQVLFADELGQTVQHSFVPVDEIRVLERFLDHVRPVAALFVETELWANTLYLLKQRFIPSVLVNARLTQSSFENYQKFAHLSQSMMNNLSLIVAQDQLSATHFVKLGANSQKIDEAYSLKYSQIIPDLQPAIERPKRLIWVMASTHEGEEILALDAYKQLLADFADVLLILVPRHPERFDAVAQLCTDFVCHRRSREPIDDTTQVYLADSMGELMKWYAMCDVAVVGGSFVDKGGHNPLEPMRLGKPVIMGPYVKNCSQIVADLVQINALTQTNQAEFYDTLKRLFANLACAKQAAQQGKQLVLERSQADKQQLLFIKKTLEHL